MVGRFVASVALAGTLLGGCIYERSDDAAAPSGTPESESAAAALDLAGELGPNGGISLDDVELQSTPGSLYTGQTEGRTAVGPVSGLAAGLTVVREGERLCLEVHGLPIGGNRIAGTCDITAYETHQEVTETGWAYASEVVIDSQPTRVAWGMTYLDAVSADLGPGTRPQTLDSAFPFWMHRFFALEAPADATGVRLLDEEGRAITTIPLQPSR